MSDRKVFSCNIFTKAKPPSDSMWLFDKSNLSMQLLLYKEKKQIKQIISIYLLLKFT